MTDNVFDVFIILIIIILLKTIVNMAKIISGGALINAMKGALGDVLDPAALQAMEVSKAMAAAGASKEEIEEMMAVILNRGGTVSQEFLEAIKEVMESGGKQLNIHITYKHPFRMSLPFLSPHCYCRT